MKNERFTSRDIEKIRLIASSRFTELLPIYQRERIVQIPDGIRCPCPIHGGDGKNFTWNTQYYNWTCWSNHCGKADDVFSFIEKLHHLSFSEALYYLADFTNIRPNSNTTLPQKIIIPTIVDKKTNTITRKLLKILYWNTRLLGKSFTTN